MNLAPIFNSAGKMLGHIDINRCRQDRASYVVDEQGGPIGPCPKWDMSMPVKDTVKFFRFPIRPIRFRWDAEDQTLHYIVIDEDIPEWVWKVCGIKFNGPKDWSEI